MTIRILPYEADGLSMRAELHLPGGDAATRPAILVFPEGFGLNRHARRQAARLAALGYVALACDLHGEARELSAMEEMRAALADIRQQPERICARARPALTALAACPQVDPDRIAAIGYCFGGTMALELWRSGAPLAGIAGFHCGLSTAAPAHAGPMRGPVLICTGADDPSVPPPQRLAFEEEMRTAGARWQMNVYGGVVHGFTNVDVDALGRPESARYDMRADRESWRTLTGFLDEIVGNPHAGAKPRASANDEPAP